MAEKPFTQRRFPTAIMHVDGDAFFTSVEQSVNPEWRGRPVVTGKERGIIACASYEAKAFGVRTAMSGSRARRLCPQACVVQPRMSAYSEASKAVFAVFEDTTPLVEGLSIDEAFLDVRGLERLSGSPIGKIEAVPASTLNPPRPLLEPDAAPGASSETGGRSSQ